jgi:predicted AAA+ superfamily ATPase
MALSNRDRIDRALEALKTGLEPFASQHLAHAYGPKWWEQVKTGLKEVSLKIKGPQDLDAQGWINVMSAHWDAAFRNVLGSSERTYLHEMRDTRNRWAHGEPFTLGDTQRALDTAVRLLEAIGAAKPAATLDQMMRELLRQRFEEDAKREAKKAQGAALQGQPAEGLLSWREIVKPHPDVLTGQFKQAEFAADLWQVHRKLMPSLEYKDPVEFFRRTYLTEGLKRILKDGLLRLNNKGGNPVLELQTNFGGGKTHTMLTLYHLFSGVDANSLPGMEAVLQDAGVMPPKVVARAVLVGTKLSPGQPEVKSDGTAVRTIWGELAWELGGRKGYDMVRKADETGTNPGQALVDLLKAHAPCVVLIDEWVAYARQLYGVNDLPGGSFDAQFTFAQALTEAASAVPGTMVVISLPQSEVELGSEGGKEALKRLKQAIGRIESPWRAASTEEGFEIVRRRLFDNPDPDKYAHRDAVIQAFSDLYVAQPEYFPSECREGDYRRKMAHCYPIHPELFERLFQDWSSLDRFQRTRGVLRLMATVIHALWVSNDQSLMILPASVPLDQLMVQDELKQYLEDNWSPVIEKDVDGPNSLPVRIDNEVDTYKRFSATRRVARTLFMGSAPTHRAANKGLEEKRIKLGSVQPGEKAPTFGDALRRLGGDATYIYNDSTRIWYSTQASASRIAEDRAEQLPQHVVDQEILRRLDVVRKHRGDFAAVHLNPSTAADVPDETDARLVVFAPDHPHNPRQAASSLATQFALSILAQRNAGDRAFKNAVVFLAPDQGQLEFLQRDARKYLAWKSVQTDAVALNLDPHTKAQADAKTNEFDKTANMHLAETYTWLLVPEQSLEENRSNAPVRFLANKVQGPDIADIAPRIIRKLKQEELLFTEMGGVILGMKLTGFDFLWRGAQHVAVKQLQDDFARYLYLPRLLNAQVLLDAIGDGTSHLLWRDETFAYADGIDEKTGRYLGLKAGDRCLPKIGGFLAKCQVADLQMSQDRAREQGPGMPVSIIPGTPANPTQPRIFNDPVLPRPGITTPKVLRRFHGHVQLNPGRTGRDAGNIAEAIIQHLALLNGAEVEVTMEVKARIPQGASEQIVRTVTENCRTLKFDGFGFEEE